MDWEALGIITPTLAAWSTLNAPADGELFRLQQSWVGEWPGTGYIRVRLFYADQTTFEDGFFETRRLYATKDEQLIALPFNPILAQAGYNVRYFQARLNLQARPYDGANWQLAIEQFAGGGTVLDGGEYV